MVKSPPKHAKIDSNGGISNNRLANDQSVTYRSRTVRAVNAEFSSGRPLLNRRDQCLYVYMFFS